MDQWVCAAQLVSTHAPHTRGDPAWSSSSPRWARYSILADQNLASGNKVLNLARDIAKYGLNVSELVIVSPIEGSDTYLVREGNRRVSAIKLSLHSERVPEGFNGLAPRFAELADTMQGHRAIECCVCDDDEEIQRLLLLRHGGESNGVGTVRWNSTQTARFSNKGKPQSTRAIALVTHLQEDYGQGDLWEAAAVIPPTNLGRLITTPEVRVRLNISQNGNDAHYLGGHDALLLDVLKTLERKKVGAVYDKNARVSLVEEAARRMEPDGWKQAQLSLDEPTGGDAGNIHELGSELNPEFDAPNRRRDATGGIAGRKPCTIDVDAQFGGIQPAVKRQPNQERLSDEGESPAPTEGQRLGEETHAAIRRRKPVINNANKPMFGHALNPRDPESNTVYRGIDWIDDQYPKLDENQQAALLPILGFSLRLLMETVARKYYEANGDDRGDKALRDFLKDVAKPAVKPKLDVVGRNNLALASEWIDGTYNFDGLFAKWAHGTLAIDRAALVRQSELVALIIDEVWT